MKTTDNILVIDLEATCWDGPIPQGQVNEIIEIGICILNRKTGTISDNRGILIKPKRSQVSPFCTELTTITPELLDREGITFAKACTILRTEYSSRELTWASYGQYDFGMLSNQCWDFKIDFPLTHDHINVKSLFALGRNSTKKVGMARALRTLGLPLDGTHHRGVDDARNIAKILDYCLK